MICKHRGCKKVFVPWYRTREYCTRVCRKLEEAALRKVHVELLCLFCRKAFKQTHGLQKYCSKDCCRFADNLRRTGKP